MALNLFEAAQSQLVVKIGDRKTWQADSAKRGERFSQALKDRIAAGQFDFEDWDALHFAIDVEMKREVWQAGEMPKGYMRCLPFMYAKLFVYALDSISRFLDKLARIPGVPSEVVKQEIAFDTAFPTLREVRNSAQHLEDRGRGLGKGGRPLKLSAGVLFLGCLNDNRYGMTMADGQYGEVEVSLQSLQNAQVCIQKTLNAFKWTGPKRHCPD